MKVICVCWLSVLAGIAYAQAGSVEGQVVNAATGEPVRKAQLILRRADPRPEAPLSVASDAGGRFAFLNVEPGSYRLWAEKTGFVRNDFGARFAGAQGTAIQVAPGAVVKDVHVKLTPQAVIAGRVLDEDGEPMVNVHVQVLRHQYLRGKRQLMAAGTGTTNDLGEYRIHSLASGKYYISARPMGMMQMLSSAAVGAGAPIRGGAGPEEGYVPTYYPRTNDAAAASPVTLAPGDVMRGMDIQLVRTRTVRVTGRIVNNTGVSGRHIMIQLRPRDAAGVAGPQSGTARQNDGRFELRGVAPGSYILTAALFADNVYYSARQPLEVGGSSLDDVQLQLAPGAELKGVLRVEGDQPLTSRNVRVALSARADGLAFGGAADPVKDDGSFLLRSVSPDEYNVLVTGLPAGFYVKSVRFGDRDALLNGLDISHGAAGTLEVTVSSKSAAVDGSVTDSDGKPIPGAQVALIPEDERRNVSMLYKTATADQSGHFQISGAAPGEYKLFAWEQVEGGAWLDPEFLKPLETKGEKVSLTEGGRETRQLKAIP